MKYLGIDYGLVRTGLAATDPDGILAYPLETLSLDRFPNRKAFLAALTERIEKEAPDVIVVGLPLMPDGSESLTTRQIRNFADRLLRRTTQPVIFMQELLSSEEAAMDLAEAGLKRKKRKAVLDQQAAVRILESYLSSPSSGIPLPRPSAQHAAKTPTESQDVQPASTQPDDPGSILSLFRTR